MKRESYTNQFGHPTFRFEYEDDDEADEADNEYLLVGQLIEILKAYPSDLPIQLDYPYKGSFLVGARIGYVMRNGNGVNIQAEEVEE